MKTFEIIKYSEEHFTVWNEFVAKSKNATFLFHRDFMEYHKDRFEDFSLMVYKEDQLVALLPANLIGNEVFSHQGLTYGSFIISEKARLFSVIEAFKDVLEFLNSQGLLKLTIHLIPSFYCLLPSDELEYFLFRAKAQLIKKDVLMVIDYRNKIKFQKKRREGINKAMRNGLVVKIDNDFDSFWNKILIPNLSNKYNVSPVHTLGEIKKLASIFPENIIQVNVYKDDTIIAGTTLFLTKTTVHPQYVSANGHKNAYGSLDLLYDYLIDAYKEDKNYFDFNTSSEDGGNVLNEGLIFWKESCGARAFVSNVYAIETEVFKTFKIPLL
jgi:hypothetical protein